MSAMTMSRVFSSEDYATLHEFVQAQPERLRDKAEYIAAELGKSGMAAEDIVAAGYEAVRATAWRTGFTVNDAVAAVAAVANTTNLHGLEIHMATIVVSAIRNLGRNYSS